MTPSTSIFFLISQPVAQSAIRSEPLVLIFVLTGIRCKVYNAGRKCGNIHFLYRSDIDGPWLASVKREF